MKKLKRYWRLSVVVLLALVAALGWVISQSSVLDQIGVLPATPSTSLRQHFEAQPRLWLDHAHDFSSFEQELLAGAVTEVGVAHESADEGPILLVTNRSDERYSTTAPVKGSQVDALLLEAEKVHPYPLTAVTIDTSSPGERLADTTLRFFDGTAKAAGVALPLALLLLCARHFGLKKKSLVAEKPDVCFQDVIGAAEAKGALAEVVAFLKYPEKYEALGARPPRGVLLDGPPGTGKTLLARALAGECGATFITIDGSYFSSMFYEQGIKRVSSLFELARAHAPCVIFIDEIDGLGARSSGSSRSSGQGEENRIINKLLVEMDGFKASEDVVIIGATNHRENIDPAMLRPGRFDQVCQVPMPNLSEREDLFAYYIARIRATAGVDSKVLAKAASGSSPADIALVTNRAAIQAAERGAVAVTQDDLHSALEALQLGGRISNVRSMVTPQTRERIAVHESGHAIVAHVAQAGSVGRISIEPRGQALGVTFVSRDEETPLYGERELNAQLAMMLAGREAELLVYGSTTSGAADDLKRASQLAMRMVTELGFSREFGVLSFSGIPTEFVSSATKERALEEARALLMEARERSRTILEQHRAILNTIADELVTRETVSSAFFTSCFQGAPELVE